MRKLDDIEVGEALPLGVMTDVDITGATVVARVSLNGAPATEYPGALDAVVGGVVNSALVPIPGTAFSAPGFAEGVIVLTREGAAWSPAKERFLVMVRRIV